jgi:hypothetical protein
MKINLDFAKNQSLGNINDNQSQDNHADFKAAKKVYADNKDNIQSSIVDTLKQGANELVAGSTITIPTGHYNDSGFVNNLTFTVDEINTDNASLSLSQVGHKTSH